MPGDHPAAGDVANIEAARTLDELGGIGAILRFILDETWPKKAAFTRVG